MGLEMGWDGRRDGRRDGMGDGTGWDGILRDRIGWDGHTGIEWDGKLT